MQWNQSTMYEQRVRFILEIHHLSPSPVDATASAGPRDTRGGIAFSRRESRDSMTDRIAPVTARTPQRTRS